VKKFTDAIRLSIKNCNWYAAIFMALTMPDICGKLEQPDKKTKDRYIEWYNQYLLKTNTMSLFNKETVLLSGNDCYALRCSVLHEGSDVVSTQEIHEILSKIHITTLGSHMIKINNILSIDVSKFCEEMCQAVEKWYDDIKNVEIIVERISNVLEIKENGFSPIPGAFIG
jgi:hypothetical protein